MEKPQYTAAHLKGMNRHVVYDFIRERGATSKAQIVKETGISPPTVIKIVSYLVERGLVVEAGEGAAGVGRRPQLLAINGPGRFSAVFALEGSFLSAVAERSVLPSVPAELGVPGTLSFL